MIDEHESEESMEGGGECEFDNPPAGEFDEMPAAAYFWDPECQEGMLGCLADGVHPECRFCGPNQAVTCPEPPTPPAPLPHECSWPLRGHPSVPFFWDETCALGQLGCLADGLNVECRFCGAGVYEEIACPTEAGARETSK